VEGEPFIDRDISGYRIKDRPAFEEMSKGIESPELMPFVQAQVLYVHSALAPTGQHRRPLDQDLPPVVQREPFAGGRRCAGSTNFHQ
jgi:hypothetical protein